MRYTEAMEWFVVALLILVVVSVIVAAVGWQRSLQAHHRIDAIFHGLSENGNLEQMLQQHFAQVHGVATKLDDIKSNYHHLSQIAAASLQKTAIVRFNPFQHTGGDQSFVLALLDNHDNGLLMTSIHSREGTRVYVKPVTYGSSEHQLSKEEQSALETAQRNTPKG